jgi:hypothetical protein
MIHELNWINQASKEALQPFLGYSAHALTTSLPSNEVLPNSGSVDSAVLQAIKCLLSKSLLGVEGCSQLLTFSHRPETAPFPEFQTVDWT